MNERTERIRKNYEPVVSIVVYRSESSITGEGEYYLESHDINENGEVSQGKPLLQETIQGIVDTLFDERKNMAKFTGMLPENLLLFSLLPGGRYKALWFRPAEERVVHFSDGLNIPTGKANVPAMLYHVDAGHLSVFALKSNKRPIEKTRLCFAPFFNVNDAGSVCLGSANVKKPKDSSYQSTLKYWEDLFWLSEFTHVNGNDKKTTTPLVDLWKKGMKQKGKINWAPELKFCKQTTLKQLL